MNICLRYNCVRVVYTYRYDNLFSKISGSYVKFQFTLYFLVVSDVIDLNDLAKDQFGKYILYFKNIFHITSKSLCI